VRRRRGERVRLQLLACVTSARGDPVGHLHRDGGGSATIRSSAAVTPP
jgi:hypothetical protein